MGSYGRLARRALETEMPIMVKVFEPCLSIIRLLFQSHFSFGVYVLLLNNCLWNRTIDSWDDN